MWLLDALYEKRNSDKIAVIHRNEALSYRELWSRSEIIAGFLQQEGLYPDAEKTPIVIYGNKENDIIPVMHAALKLGVPYVPVDTTYPVERLEKIMAQVSAKVLFNFSELDINYNACEFKITDLKNIYNKYSSLKSSLGNWVEDNDLCYILFTSGSTGEPKGVPIRKKNIVNFTRWVEQYAVSGLEEDFVAMNQVSYSFDVSVFALYLYLPLGHAIYSIDKLMLNDMKELFQWLPVSQIAVWVSTPSFIEICAYDDKFNEHLLPKLRKVILAGEILTKLLVKTIEERFPKTSVVNGYGPTECTVLLTACEITSEMLNAKDSLPIGYILDDASYTLENAYEDEGKTVGELSVISNSVSLGYYNNVEKSAEKFWYDESSGKHGYRTGDLVYEKNGLIYYVGRIDSQIKLNGYRMELDDISENINKLTYVTNNVILPIKEEGKVQYLTAIVILKELVEKSKLKMILRIKKDLAALVPSYMVPKKICFVESFPLNVSGKIDRKKLLEMAK